MNRLNSHTLVSGAMSPELEKNGVYSRNPHGRLTSPAMRLPSVYRPAHPRMEHRAKRLMKGGNSKVAEGVLRDTMGWLRYWSSSRGGVVMRSGNSTFSSPSMIPDPILGRSRGSWLVATTKASHASRAFHHERTEERRSMHRRVLEVYAQDESVTTTSSTPSTPSTRPTATAVGDAMSMEARVVTAIEGLRPSVETISVKRGGAAYQVPVPIHGPRQVSRAIRWLLESARTRVRKDKVPGLGKALALEVLHVLADQQARASTGGSTSSSETAKERTSLSMPKRRALHRLAKASRVHAHRRWR